MNSFVKNKLCQSSLPRTGGGGGMTVEMINFSNQDSETQATT